MVEEPLWLTNARRPTRTWAARLSAAMNMIMIWPLLWWAISEVHWWHEWWRIKTSNVLGNCYLVCACVQSIDRVCLWLRIRLLRRNTSITSCWNAAKSHQQHCFLSHCFKITPVIIVSAPVHSWGEQPKLSPGPTQGNVRKWRNINYRGYQDGKRVRI